MRTKHFLAAFTVGCALVPLAASAQTIILSDSAKAQLAGLATQLVQIMGQLSAAVAQGPSYTNSAAFQPVANSIATQLAQVQAQLVAILSTGVAAAPPINTNSCPKITRALSFGMQGTDILLVQQFLAGNNAAHYSGALSGVFDSETLAAVQRFQAAYGVVSYGTPDTTGYGRVGPATANMIARVCSGLMSTVPTPTTPYLPPIQPPVISVPTTGTLAVTTSGLPQKAVSIRVTANPNSSCAASSFTLEFGDGQQQTVSFPGSCASQAQSFVHVYPATGTYTAVLRSGTFITTLPINVVQSNYTLVLSATAGSASFTSNLTLTFNPGTRCDNATYTLKWGDSADQTVSFNGSSCSTQTKTISHTYPSVGTFAIQANDGQGSVASISFNSVAVLAAGAGDPYITVSLPFDGAQNSTTITDTGPNHLSFTASGGAKLDQTTLVDGTASLRLPGTGFVSTPAHTAYSLGSLPFTIDLWFAAESFPGANKQAAILVQADSNASDNSLGGAGLILYGSKLYFVGRIGSATYHPFYNNSIHTGDLVLGAWYHVALVRSGSTLKMYLNGVSQGSITVAGAANDSSAPLTLGRYGDYDGNYFTGWVDEVHIAKGNARWVSDFNPLDYYGLEDGSQINVVAQSTGTRQATITVTRTPGAVCVATSYDIDFGDGANASVSFDGNCTIQTATAVHTYAQAGTYTITAANASISDTTTVTVYDAATTGGSYDYTPQQWRDPGGNGG